MNTPQTQGNVPVANTGVENPVWQQPQAPAQPAQPPVAPAPTPDASTNDRTKEQFEKLLDSNRRLYEANQQLTAANKPREPQPIAPKAPVQTPQNQQVDPRDFIERDPVTGEQYINETKMKSRIREIEDRASRAEDTINSYIKTAEKKDIDRQNAETFLAYPELEPGNKDKFDADFSRQVRSVIYDALLNVNDYGGRPLSFKEAADFVRKQNSPVTPTTPVKEGNSPAGESTAPVGNAKKEQGSAQVPSTPQNPPSETNSQELENLKQLTRVGNDEALAMRIVAMEQAAKAA